VHGQYRIYRDGNDIIGFCNWCFLNDLTQAKFIKSGIISPDQWKSGENLWMHDVVASKNTVRILKDIKKMCLIMIGNRKQVNYLRIKNSEIFARRKIQTKNHWGK
jgi:hemolysin-activating ACP:hemolysin acyltransferase